MNAPHRIVSALLPALLTTAALGAAAHSADPPAAPGFKSRAAIVAAYASGKIERVDFDPPVPDGVTVQRGVVYKEASDKEIKLDLYRPAGAETPRPLLVFIHGGGWSSGGRWHYKGYCGHFAARGYVAATIDYRLSGDAPYPAALDDCRDAIAWLCERADEYRIDPERIGVAGGSAGGHLAMLVGYTGKTDVKAVATIYGVYDLTVPEMRNNPMVRAFLGWAKYGDAPEKFLRASPKSHLDAADPPTLAIHGTLDKIVPVSHSDALVEKLDRLGIVHHYDRLEGWNHVMDVASPVNRRCVWQMERFFGKQLPVSTPAEE